jgi:hypothetical protein
MFQPSASTESFKPEVLTKKDVPYTNDMTTRPGEDTNTHITDAGNDNDSAASEDDDCETSEDDDSELSDDDVSEASEHFPANHLLVREGRRTN